MMRSVVPGIALCLFWAWPLAVAAQTDEPVDVSVQVTPLMRYVGVNEDEDKFREDWWIRDGWSGGLQSLDVRAALGEDTTFRLKGRALVPEEYNLDLELIKEDLGFIRAGCKEYRKYYDDTGGFFEPFQTPSFDLGKDMHLDIGDLFLEVGFTLPEWPRVVLGYEHRYKEGEKSLLEWGSVSRGGAARKIFPSFQEIDSEVDIVRAEIDHEIGGFQLRDRLRYEHHQSDTTRHEEERDLDAGASETVTVSEDYEHDAWFNTFHMENHFSDKLYWSAGYLFSNLEGDAAFRMITAPFGPEPFDKNWFSRAIDMGQDSHVVNVNGLVGPYQDFTLYGGVQTELTETEGETAAVLAETLPGVGPASPEADIETSEDKNGFEEEIGVRYGGIPRTTLYVEGRWSQQQIDLLEREVQDAALGFERLTDTEVDRERCTLGFHSSPLREITISGRYRRSVRENDYDHKGDTEPGYSAFIVNQEITTDEISAKLTYRAASWLNASFQYRLLDSEFRTLTDTTPPSSLASGDYEADVYSVSATLTPVLNLYATALFSYRDVRSESFVDGVGSVIPYKGDVYTLLGTAGWAMSEKSDLRVEYLFTRSSNFMDNASEGLPLGVDNKRHGLLTEISRQVTGSIRALFRYGYYRYTEEGNDGEDDYSAHLLGFGCEFTF